MEAYSAELAGTVEAPRYTMPEVARYLRMPETTLKSWVAGRSYSTTARGTLWWANLINRPDPLDPRLSFSNLIEAYTLLSLRKQYSVKMKVVRDALDYAKEELGVSRILLSKDLRVMHGSIFVQRVNELLNIGRRGQVAIPGILNAYLQRIEWDELRGLPLRIFPLTRADNPDSPRLLTINPQIAVGRPIVERKAIKTAIIATRFKAGESIAELAEDYDLEAVEVEEALRYEAIPLAA